MNKYQEALDELCDCAMEREDDYDMDDNLIVNYYYLNHEDLKRLREPLQELVEKATPKIPIKEEDEKGFITRYYCPNCGEYFECHYKDEVRNESPHCHLCGQRILWSESEEEQ